MIAIDRPFSAANALPPGRMAPAERRAELCQILALGLIRLRLHQSSRECSEAGESSLHFGRDQSGRVDPTTKGATV